MDNRPKLKITGLLADETGVAMLVAMLVTTGLLLLGAYGSYIAQTEVRIALNELLAKQAFGLAEGGVNHSLGVITQADGFDDELAAGGTGGGLERLGELETLDDDRKQYRFHPSRDGSEDGYYVRFEDNFDETFDDIADAVPDNPNDDTDNIIRIVARGMVEDAERTVEAVVQVLQGPTCALLTQGQLQIRGDALVSGTQGCVHSNDDLTLTGNPTLEAGGTSTDDLSITGVPVVEGNQLDRGERTEYISTHENQPAVSIPQVNPLNFGGPTGGRNLALEVAQLPVAGTTRGYRLDANCQVYIDDPGSAADNWTCTQNPPNCNGGTVVTVTELPAGWGWDCTPGAITRWRIGANQALDGAYFVEGRVEINGSPGSLDPDIPWRATIIALNSIDIGGFPTMAPVTTTGTLRNLLLVSGNDVEMSGNGNSRFTGGVFTHQQVQFNGNVSLHGFAMAEGGRTTWAGDPAPNCRSPEDLLCTTNLLFGNAEIIYSGISTEGFGSNLVVKAWSEVRAQ